MVGFSDITALHILFNQIYHLPSIHGNVAMWIEDINDIKQIMNAIAGNEQNFFLMPINDLAISMRESPIKGIVSGGNLTVYTTLIGTKLHPHTDGKILVFEDISEKGYAVKRKLIHLLYSGIFDNIPALIFGEFTKGDGLVEYAILDFCRKEIPKIPAFKIFNVGHVRPNYPLGLNVVANIVNNNFTYKFE